MTCEIKGCSARALHTLEEEVVKDKRYYGADGQYHLEDRRIVKSGAKLCTKHKKKYEKERRKNSDK